MTRTKIFRTTAVLFLLLAGFSACRQDDLPGPSAPGGGTATTLAFVSDPMALQRVTTRSSDMKDEEEKRINRLYIFFFDAGGEYLDGDYLTGYPNAPDDGGYYAAGEGVSLLKIDAADGGVCFSIVSLNLHTLAECGKGFVPARE